MDNKNNNNADTMRTSPLDVSDEGSKPIVHLVERQFGSPHDVISKFRE